MDDQAVSTLTTLLLDPSCSGSFPVFVLRATLPCFAPRTTTLLSRHHPEAVEPLHTRPLMQHLCVGDGADAQVGMTGEVAGHLDPVAQVALDAGLVQVPGGHTGRCEAVDRCGNREV